jgi:HSP20 family protein
VRSRIHAVVLPSEAGELADEVRRVFAELGRTFGFESLAGECAPAVDVFETDDGVEVTVDLPGVDPAAVRVIVKQNTLLVAGEKAVRRGGVDATFHLVERGFGRFARTIRLPLACDAGRATATLAEGQLRIRLPKVTERRGQPISIAIDASGRDR